MARRRWCGGSCDGASGCDSGGSNGSGRVVEVNVCASEVRGEEEKTLIQDEYNEGKELCKEIKKKNRERKNF